MASQSMFIPLTGGMTATIDADDWTRAFQFENRGVLYTFRICDLSWHAEEGGTNGRRRYTTYARSSVRRNGTKFSLRLHTLIMGKRDGMVIEHINRNGLDCTRRNLEHIPHSENIRRGMAARRQRLRYSNA